MRIAVSNIAWDEGEHADVLALLSARGITGIEVAPTKLWPDWTGADGEAATHAAARLAGQGFTVPALQAILFGRPELSVYAGDEAGRAALLDHIERVAEIAAGLGARCLVFGSPRNRDPGERSPEAAIADALPVFRAMGERCHARGVQLCIEANPPVYACRFLTRWREAADFVRQVGHPGVGLHLDGACTLLAGDDPAAAVAEVIDILSHVHISEPELGGFETPQVDHRAFGAALRAAGYQRWCSVEMRRQEAPVAAIATALDVALDCYG